MRGFAFIPLTLLAIASCLLAGNPAMSQETYEARVYTNDKGEKLNYRLMQPAGHDAKAETKHPLVLFLHGAGERGDDNVKQLVHAAKDFASEANRTKYPCFVVFPQCPEGKRWVEVDWTLDSHKQLPEESISVKLTRELIASLQKEFRVDEKRLYATGLSMGGFGVWDMAARTPDMFAAALPVCAGADEATADRLTRLPIWTFHGDKDTVVKVERSRRMVAAIEKAGGQPKYTEYPGVQHNSWTQTYADPKVMEWLFAQKRP
ncbi:MAG: PHB depolymerase family esterase [Planctomycetota bacterium]